MIFVRCVIALRSRFQSSSYINGQIVHTVGRMNHWHWLHFGDLGILIREERKDLCLCNSTNGYKLVQTRWTRQTDGSEWIDPETGSWFTPGIFNRTYHFVATTYLRIGEERCGISRRFHSARVARKRDAIAGRRLVAL